MMLLGTLKANSPGVSQVKWADAKLVLSAKLGKQNCVKLGSCGHMFTQVVYLERISNK